MYILGINIIKINKKEIIKELNTFLNNNKNNLITTPNPEIILKAQKDEELFYILNKADLSIPDGIGLKFAGFALFKNIIRTTGADLLIELLKIAENQNKKVAIINWNKGLSSEKDILNALKNRFLNLKFAIFSVDKENIKNINIKNICKFNPEIVICSLGFPYQEKFLFHNLKKIKSAKISIGIGGAFDFLTNRIKRAPKILRIFGLEWFWRLLQQPIRIKRIFNAVVIFPIKFCKVHFINFLFYRPNVSCMLYKKENKNYKILLVEKSEEKGHWQLPQGGTDSENIITAGARELSEELGTDKFKIKNSFRNLYKYKFDKKINKRFDGYKGQKQGLVIAEFFGNDNDIKINFWDHSNWKWVDSKNLIQEVHSLRKQSAKIFLDKFSKLKL